MEENKQKACFGFFILNIKSEATKSMWKSKGGSEETEKEGGV